METLNVKNYIRIAQYRDVFYANDILVNREVFYKSVKTAALSGPFGLSSNKSIVELLVELDLQMLYVIDNDTITENSIAIKLKLKKAQLSDVKEDSKTYKKNSAFYILNNQKKIQGPFYIRPSTNITQLNKDIINKDAYVMAQNFNIQIIEEQKLAS